VPYPYERCLADAPAPWPNTRVGRACRSWRWCEVACLWPLPQVIDRITADEQPEREERESTSRGGRGSSDVCAKTVILVDDGLATRTSMRVSPGQAGAAYSCPCPPVPKGC